jgi:hypothetical protein
LLPEEHPEELTALTLAPAEWWPMTGGGVAFELPVVRIPLDRIDLWWLIGGKKIAEAERGSSWFVGGVIPFGS